MSFNRIATLSSRMLNEHIADLIIHITAAERELWNDKSYITSGDYKLTAPALTADAVAALEGHKHGVADITDFEATINAKLAAVLAWKGVVDSVDALPGEGNKQGDVYGIGTDEYVWNGTTWEKLGSNQDFSIFALKTQVAEDIAAAIAQEVLDRDAAIKVVTDAQAIKDGAQDEAIGKVAEDLATEIQNRTDAVAGINGSTVKLTGYTPVSEDDSVALTESNSVNEAFRSIVSYLNALEIASGGNTEGITALANQLTGVDNRVVAVESVLKGYNGESAVANAIAAAQSGAEATAAADATAKADAAQAAAIAAAATDAQGKADAAQAAAIAAAATDATGKADAAQAAAIAAAATDATNKSDAAKSAAIAAAAEDATTKAGNAKSEAIAAAAEDATTKAGNAKSEAIAAAETKAGELDAALKQELTGAIATAKGEAIADAEGKIATAKGEAIADAEGKIATAKGEAIADAEGKIAAAVEEIDGRLDAIEAVKDHGAEFNGAGVSAAEVLSDLQTYGMKVVYTVVDGATITLPTDEALKGFGAEVIVIVPASGKVTVTDGVQSEVFSAPADSKMSFTFGTIAESDGSFGWYFFG